MKRFLLIRRYASFIVVLAAGLLLAAGQPSVTLVASGNAATDTAALVKACASGGIVYLAAGVFQTTQTIKCKTMASENGEALFWYYGQQPTTQIVSVGPTFTGSSVLACISPCLFRGFQVTPGDNLDGIAIQGPARLIDMSVVTTAASGHCVNLTNTGGISDFFIRGGTYSHCGGWCVYQGFTSSGYVADSGIFDADFANCGKGAIYLYNTTKMKISSNLIQDEFAMNGLVIDFGSHMVISANNFDQNAVDLSLGSVQRVSIGSNNSASNGLFLLVRGAAAWFNIFGNSAFELKYKVLSSGGINGFPGSLWNSEIRDIYPTYADTYTQNMLAPQIH